MLTNRIVRLIETLYYAAAYCIPYCIVSQHKSPSIIQNYFTKHVTEQVSKVHRNTILLPYCIVYILLYYRSAQVTLHNLRQSHESHRTFSLSE